jgi:cytochrome c peroxidase
VSEKETATLSRHGDQPFRFGPEELTGLKVFLREKGPQPAGNCIACHAPPLFTDSSFHAIGTAQLDYDTHHGFGAFAGLSWSGSQRLKWREPGIPDAQDVSAFDAGVWHTLSHPVNLASKPLLATLLCPAPEVCSQDELLKRSVGRFKTPTLRNLGQSAPYFHNGLRLTLPESVAFYVTASQLARSGDLFNADPELQSVGISGRDIPALTRFLQSLNEDYD